jgi:ring-1,2-phenylacetyl-CoA epoxidase subunit PaaE
MMDKYLMRWIKVKLFGSFTNIKVEAGETILHSAMLSGLQPPYNCCVGACATCRAMLNEGRIEMEDDSALSDAEIAFGLILTCQAHPVSDGVIIDYDI